MSIILLTNSLHVTVNIKVKITKIVIIILRKNKLNDAKSNTTRVHVPQVFLIQTGATITIASYLWM